MRQLITPLLYCVAFPATAQMYKCAEGGRTVFQDIPCSAPQASKMNTVGEEIERRKQVKAEAAAHEQACKDKFKGKLEVTNSPWDDSVGAVERYLKSGYLKEPDSFQAVEWGKVVKRCGEYAVRLKYRARNSVGSYVVETRDFLISADGVVVGSVQR